MSALRNISRKQRISISTLKDASRKLKQLGLVDYGNTKEWKIPRVTDAGKIVLKIVEGDFHGTS
ncbi:MAG TPA: hypothetical protein ENG45_01130 [Candidatus Aenigmarchaeota archaeon]|nr:hypothetical protein [Candidatus Aenigmarchaeota archaeon]